jgi:hypothetical protein
LGRWGRAKGKFPGRWGISDVGLRGFRRHSRAPKDVRLPRTLERGVNKLLGPTSTRASVASPRRGVTSDHPGRRAGARRGEGLASVGGTRADNDGGWNMASVVWRARLASAATTELHYAASVVAWRCAASRGVRLPSSWAGPLCGGGLATPLRLVPGARRRRWQIYSCGQS